MSLKSRLNKLEDEFLKSADYYKGMKIMKEIIRIEETGTDEEKEQSFNLLAELHSLNSTSKYIYPK